MNKNKIKQVSSLLLLCGSVLAVTGCSGNIEDKFFVINNGKDLEVTFCDRGAAIYSIKYKDQYVTYHPKDKSTYLKDDYYYGKALGRVAGRIKDGKISVNGKDYELEINETSGKKHNSIHGGKNSLTARDFKRYVENTSACTRVSFNYVSPALEAGYPELLDVWYTYTIYKTSNDIDINIYATSTGTTPVNLSNHPYFRLGNDGDVLEHELTINASEMAKFDDAAQDQVVVGVKDVKDTPFDFTSAKKIGKDIAKAKELDPTSGGYDHIWKFDGDEKENNYVKLSNAKTNISLKVTSDADAVICYSNCYPHDKLEMNPSGADALYAGITIEPIKFFSKDSVSDLNITPDKPFKRSITYSFDKVS